MRRRQLLLVGAAALGGCSGLRDGSSEDDRSRARPNGADRTVIPEGTAVSNAVVVEGRRQRPPTEEVYVLVRVTAENRGTDPIQAPKVPWFEVADGDDGYVPLGGGEEPDSISEPVEGQIYHDAGRMDPGASRTGWLVGELPESADDPTLRFADPETNRTLEWALPVDLAADRPDLARPEVTMGDPEAGTAGEASVAVDNRGSADATYEASYTLSFPARPSRTGDLSVSVPAGERETATVPVEPWALGTVRFDIPIEGLTRTTRVETGRRSFGDRFTVPGSAAVTVERLTTADTYAWTADGASGERESGDRARWALVEVAVENRTDEPVGRPQPGDLEVVGGSADGYEPVDPDLPADARLSAPVTGQVYDPADASAGAGETGGGWLVYEIVSIDEPAALGVRGTWSIGADARTRCRWE